MIIDYFKAAGSDMIVVNEDRLHNPNKAMPERYVDYDCQRFKGYTLCDEHKRPYNSVLVRNKATSKTCTVCKVVTTTQEYTDNAQNKKKRNEKKNNITIKEMISLGEQMGPSIYGNAYDLKNGSIIYPTGGLYKYIFINYDKAIPCIQKMPETKEEILSLIATDPRFLGELDPNYIIKVFNGEKDILKIIKKCISTGIKTILDYQSTLEVEFNDKEMEEREAYANTCVDVYKNFEKNYQTTLKLNNIFSEEQEG